MTADWRSSRLRCVSILLIVGVNLGCGPGRAPGASEMSAVESSRFRVSLPSPYLSGYAADLKGEVLQYHSPVPMIGASLLVRSEERGRSIAWESGVIPADFRGDAVTFALMIGIDVNVEPRRFDLRIGGRDVIQLRNPLEAALGEVLLVHNDLAPHLN